MGLKDQITSLAGLMDEFGLRESKVAAEDWSIEFSREDDRAVTMVSAPGAQANPPPAAPKRTPAKPKVEAPKGTPISSPMTGVFYSSPSPGAPEFVKVGDTVQAGQVVGLIEAMKVFNEITATVSGTVLDVKCRSGALVNPGEPIMFIG